MGIKVDKRMVDAVCRYLDKCAKIVHDEIMNTLSYLGETCIIKIRDRSGADSWFDQTGNLRSSIGYAVYNNGVSVIESAFRQVLDGQEGVEAGRKMINELASKYATTYALVVVAGMNYADKVEAMDNKDVLASTELWARKTIDSYLERAKEKALKKINSLKL